ncbi:MAG: B12-binding domain-containing protein [Rhizobacter sp.]|nr:B12-binding domain-containing protein [Chlorobiales bacterium]
MNQFYSTRELSELCGVAETTVKRWSNMGMIRHHKTLGGHRKFKLEDVLEFLNKNNIAIPEGRIEKITTEKKYAESIDLGTEILFIKHDTENLSQRLLEHMLAFRKDETETLLVKALEEGYSFAEIFDLLIAPAMHEVGMLWATKKLNVGEEHVITSNLTEAIVRLKSRFETSRAHQQKQQSRSTWKRSFEDQQMPADAATHALKEEAERRQPKARVVVCTCADSEMHEVGLLGVSLVCQSAGFEVSYVGGTVPFKELEKLIETVKPEAVCMSITLAGLSAEKLRRYELFRKFLKQRGIRLIIGGQFFGEKKSRPIEADLRARNCQELEQYLKENFEMD